MLSIHVHYNERTVFIVLIYKGVYVEFKKGHSLCVCERVSLCTRCDMISLFPISALNDLFPGPCANTHAHINMHSNA